MEKSPMTSKQTLVERITAKYRGDKKLTPDERIDKEWGGLIIDYINVKTLIDDCHKGTITSGAVIEKLRGLYKSENPSIKLPSHITAIHNYINFGLLIFDPTLTVAFYDILFNAFVSEFMGPEHLFEIVLKLEGLLDVLMLSRRGKHSIHDDDLSNLLMAIKRHASSRHPSLIVGETGTSKQLTARVIHKLGQRRQCEIIEINCAAIPEGILESELFGAIPNYPGFHNPKGLTGKIEAANGGILFLDELGKASLNMQAKLLKAIEERKVTRLGAEEPTAVDVIFIGAAHPVDIENKKVLPDLIYRMGYPDSIDMPTLKQRLEVDRRAPIEASFRHVMLEMIQSRETVQIAKGSDGAIYCAEIGVPPINHITDAVYDELNSHTFDGNYRELHNILRAAAWNAIYNGRKKIVVDDLTVLRKIQRKRSAESVTPLIPAKEQDKVMKGPLKDTFKTLDNITREYAKPVVEEKIYQVLRSGQNIKYVLTEEQKMSITEYQAFLKQVEEMTGQNLRQIIKRFKSKVQ